MYVCVCIFNHVQLFVAPWTVAHQASLSLGFPRQEYWDTVRCCLLSPIPGDLPDLGSNLHLLSLLLCQADSLPLHHLQSLHVHTHTHTHTHLCIMCVYVRMRIWFTSPQQTACGGLCYKQDPSNNQNK